jgi:hypothetical protein
MSRLTETQVPVVVDSRWRRVTDPLNSIEYTVHPPLQRTTMLRLADLIFQRSQPVITGRSVRWIEFTGTVPTPQTVLTTAFNDTDATASQVVTALAAAMQSTSAASGKGWAYVPSTDLSITIVLVADATARMILEPTAEQVLTGAAAPPLGVTQTDFQHRLASSLLYEMGFDMAALLDFRATAPFVNIVFQPTQATRMRGDDVVFVRMLVNGREVGDISIARTEVIGQIAIRPSEPGYHEPTLLGGAANPLFPAMVSGVVAYVPSTPMTFLARLSLTAVQGGTAFLGGLPWITALRCETLRSFRVEFWRYAAGSFEPYNMRGNDYSGLFYAVTQEQVAAQ